MTNRVKGFTIILANDIREDDAVALQNAILMFNGVLAVQPKIVKGEDYIIAERERIKLKQSIINSL